MNAPLTQIELDIITAGGCQHPECKDPLCGNETFLHSQCHPGALLAVRYEKGSGVLNVMCGRCKRPVSNIKVSLT